MTKQEKKDFINKLIAEGDKRSYNQIVADVELYLWNARWKFPFNIKNLTAEVK